MCTSQVYEPAYPATLPRKRHQHVIPLSLAIESPQLSAPGSGSRADCPDCLLSIPEGSCFSLDRHVILTRLAKSESPYSTASLDMPSTIEMERQKAPAENRGFSIAL